MALYNVLHRFSAQQHQKAGPIFTVHLITCDLATPSKSQAGAKLITKRNE